MTDRPILFSDAMARAILAGTKTQTRRVMMPQPVEDGGTPVVGAYHPIVVRRGIEEPGPERWGASTEEQSWPCPYGQPGDRLWVREPHFRFGHWEPVATKRTRTGRQKWRFVADSDAVLFTAPSERSEVRGGRHHADPSTPAWHARLARFMPRALSRLTLEITSVRVERLQTISAEDAVAEGVFGEGRYATSPPLPYPVATFRKLWDSINGFREGCAWADSPWVWAVSFKRAEST